MQRPNRVHVNFLLVKNLFYLGLALYMSHLVASPSYREDSQAAVVQDLVLTLPSSCDYATCTPGKIRFVILSQLTYPCSFAIRT